jgi:hypothetical protein
MAVVVSVDLRGLFGNCRDQGSRPTCLAFVVSDVHAALRQPWADLSCEYVFYNAQVRANRSPHQPALIRPMLDALRYDGQPVETDCPYLPTLPEDLSFYGPKRGLTVYRRSADVGDARLDALIALLDAGVPFVIILDPSDAFYRPDGGGVIRAAEGERPDASRRHAVVALGHGIADIGSVLLVRNSWGPAWGIDGCAWLPFSYLKNCLVSAIVLLEELDVSGTNLAA